MGTEVARQKCTRQLEPQCPSRPEIARQKDQTIHTRHTYPTAGSSVSFEARNCKTKRADNTYIPGSWSPSECEGISHLGQQDSHGFNLGGSSDMHRPLRSRSRPRQLLPHPPQQPPPRRLLENLQPSRPIVCREADCARRGELIAEDLEFVFMRGLWRLRFFCGRCGSCTLEACPSTSESEEQESQEQYPYHSRVAQEDRATEA